MYVRNFHQSAASQRVKLSYLSLRLRRRVITYWRQRPVTHRAACTIGTVINPQFRDVVTCHVLLPAISPDIPRWRYRSVNGPCVLVEKKIRFYDVTKLIVTSNVRRQRGHLGLAYASFVSVSRGRSFSV